ncbi:NADH dehydrogenase [ubiquinone] 1 alpha subcomplex subunit 13-like [Macrobrachium nipponense]|uniref:NADH dehydrogenase [ubiquinone] 1 alpha subcomplex subunit 13-like n=1 Tax=Macrobrachium nipponense TaxID=159736 RepID=UPI0030C8BB73
MAARAQDLPPKGGYAPVSFKRIPAKSLFSGLPLFIGYGIATAVGGYIYYLTLKTIRHEEIEMKSADNALLPLLMAERDRSLLLQLRKNRDEEASLMSGVEGWEVGTYYGEPIYKTVPQSKFMDPIPKEYYAHGPTSSYSRGTHLNLWV